MANVTITVRVTEAAAIADGIDQSGDFSVVIQPSQLSDGARAIASKLTTTPVWSDSWTPPYHLPVPTTPTTESVHGWLEAMAAKQTKTLAAEAAEKAVKLAADKVKVRAYLDGGAEELVEFCYEGYYSIKTLPYNVQVPAELSDEYQAIVHAAHSIAKDRNAAHKARNDAEAAARDAATTMKVARRADQIATWLAVKGTDAMRKRAARGLLPEADILAGMRDDIFAPLASMPRFQRITDADVRSACDPEGYDESEVEYFTRDAETAHDEDVAFMERIERLIPGCKTELLEHVGYLASMNGTDDPEFSRYAIKVAVQVGELTFTREYAAH